MMNNSPDLLQTILPLFAILALLVVGAFAHALIRLVNNASDYLRAKTEELERPVREAEAQHRNWLRMHGNAWEKFWVRFNYGNTERLKDRVS
jgi:hypothetical protein